jgi:hypothetical protein
MQDRPQPLRHLISQLSPAELHPTKPPNLRLVLRCKTNKHIAGLFVIKVNFDNGAIIARKLRSVNDLTRLWPRFL